MYFSDEKSTYISYKSLFGKSLQYCDNEQTKKLE
jgi:hypothetical protein